MSLVVLLSAKGSPGVTTAAVALAAGWPADRSAVVVEADVAGGDLAATCGLAIDPGLGSLASAGRHGFDSDTLLAHSQILPCGIRAVVGPPSDSEAAAALEALRTNLEPALASSPIDVLADCGRFSSDETLETLLAHADLGLIVTRPTLAGVEHVAARLTVIRSMTPHVELLLVGERPYPPAEVAETLGCQVAGVVPDDARGAQSLFSPGGVNSWWGARSALVRSARSIADGLASRLPNSPTIPAEPPAPRIPPAPAEPMRVAATARSITGRRP